MSLSLSRTSSILFIGAFIANEDNKQWLHRTARWRTFKRSALFRFRNKTE
jgi:hypothetical protein